MHRAVVLVSCLVVAGFGLAATSEVDMVKLQTRLMAEIDRDTRETSGYTGQAELHPRVREAMQSVPRHRFVDLHGPEAAYANRPLSIGHNQTISQPFIVALMTDLLDPQPTDRVLEIGTGSGYQAAVLSELVSQVYSIEIIEDLAVEAAERLTRLGYQNISVRSGDGYFGWPDEGPFDGIIVTAVGPDIPPSLLDQLKVGGRMVLPVGTQRSAQNLTVVTKHADDSVSTREVLPVVFVPLTGEH
jgi:protein-L-isoaspartate(D-aspartate) O-methyltransferase